MPRTATNPQTGETVQFDEASGQWVPIGGAQPQTQQQSSQPSTMDQIVRQLGLTARSGIQGATALPSLVAEPVRQGLNLIPGVNFPPQSQAVSDFLTQLGLPQPQNPVERVAAGGAEALAGGGGLMALGKGIAQTAPTLSKILTTAPRMQAEAAIGGGLGAAGAKEAGGGPLTQIAASLAGGLSVPALDTAITKGIPAMVKSISEFTVQSPTKQKIAKMLEENTQNIETAKYKLSSPVDKLQKAMTKGAPKIIKDRSAIEAIKQGFDEGTIATVKGASSVDKRIMLKMTKIMEQGKKNARYAMTNRPSDIVGDSLKKRFDTVLKVNKNAGSQLDDIAKRLRGEQANISPAADSFVNDLDSIGVKINDDATLNFVGSDIEGLAAPEKILTNVFNRLKSMSGDAYDAHRVKRFIDENVSYGKSAEGLTGKAESIVKSLRRNIDSVLDEKFPAYNKVNTRYSDTIDVLNEFQGIAGKKMDLTGPNAEKAIGTLMRRLMSNTQSRVNLLDSVNNIENTATKYGGKFNDDLLTQVLFADELDSVFGPVAKTSFQGQIGQAVERTARAAASPKEAAISAVGEAANKLRGIDQEGAFKAIRKVLRGSQNGQ